MLWLLALPCLLVGEPVVLSDCETVDGWSNGVELSDQAKVGQHAIRFNVTPGKPAGYSLNLGGSAAKIDEFRKVRFWYRFSGEGKSSLALKVVAFPFARGWQATWFVTNDAPIDEAWQQATVDLGTPYMQWGGGPDKTNRYLNFRTQGSEDSKLTLEIDQVELLVSLFHLDRATAGLKGQNAEISVDLTNPTDETLKLQVACGEQTATKAVASGAAETFALSCPISTDWLRTAKPLESLELPVTVQLEGQPETMETTTVSVTKPLDLPPHPRLLLLPADLASIRDRIARAPWAKAYWESQLKSADNWLKSEIVLPPRGGQWWHWYACKQDGANLKTVSPTEHKCPVCGTVYTGWPYDDVVLDRDHGRLSSGLRTLGLVYQLTGDARYAAKGREILLAYADRYLKYPLHNIHGDPKVGGGHVGPQTLDEATWLIPMTQGADLIWETLSEADRKQAEEGLFRPAAQTILDHHMSIHNIQCWKNSAVGLVGLLLNDGSLVADAVESDHGFKAQIAQGVSDDGQWYEGAWGYHFYTVMAIAALAEAGQNCGLDLYGYESHGHSYRSLFEGPLDLAMPDLRLPAFNDSGTARVLGNNHYELALGRYGEARLAEPLVGTKRQDLYAFIRGVEPLPEPPAEVHGSRNFPAAGYAVLELGEGSDATWLCLKYGPHGGGHGHPDKLNFVLYSQGHILGVDPGTAHYGVPIQKEWFRTTLAHNTLTVDEGSQNQATGKCLAFGSQGRLAATLAEAGPIYEGVTYRRAIALAGPNLVLILDHASADADHTFDLAYHNAGTWSTKPTGAAVTLPDKLGYNHLHDLVQVNGALPSITVKDGPTVGVAVTTLGPSETWAGRGGGRSEDERVPIIVSRTLGRSAVVGWAIALDGTVPTVKVEAVEGGFRLSSGQATLTVTPEAAAKLTVAAGGEVLEAKAE